jgi:uncharacterized protein YjiS (DUF1127 family)
MSIKKDIFNVLGLIKTWIKSLRTENKLRSFNNRGLKNIGLTKTDFVQGTNELFKI